MNYPTTTNGTANGHAPTIHGDGLPTVAPADIGPVPPHALAVERAVLGAALVDSAQLARAVAALPPDAFYRSRHALIFQSLRALFETGENADLVTVTEHLRRRDRLDECGGAPYLTSLAAGHSGASVDPWCRILLEKAVLRGIIRSCQEATGRAYRPSADAFAEMSTVEEDLRRLFAHYTGSGETTADGPTLARLAVEELRTVPSTLVNLDDISGGFPQGRVTLLAARPSHGKTSVGLALAHRAASAARPALYFSCEMSAQHVARRLASIAGSPERLASLPLCVDDTARPTTAYILARCMTQQPRPAIVFFDYLEYTGEAKGRDRRDRCNAALDGLHEVARRLDVPVVAMHQLNRNIEHRGSGAEPQLSDLRETGEQQAAQILMLHNPFIHWDQQGRQGTPPPADVLDCYVRKNTYGRLGHVRLAFDASAGHVRSYTREVF